MPNVADDELLLHGTCVAFGSRAAVLRGAAGAGKSDLALRVLSAYAASGGDEAAALVADDYVRLIVEDGSLLARPPAAIAGLMEVRGVGIVTVPHRSEATLELIVDLVPREEVERLPPDPLPRTDLLGVAVAVTKLAAFEASSPAKLKLLLTGTL